MKPGIWISKIWFDADVLELRIRISDGTSSFSNEVYAGHESFKDAISSLDAFKGHVHGGLLDLRFGAFGPGVCKWSLPCKIPLLECR
jgi:hypothetical protein